MSDPPGEEDEGTLGYDELARLDVPDSHHPAALAWQEGLGVHLLTERKPRISADPPLLCAVKQTFLIICERFLRDFWAQHCL